MNIDVKFEEITKHLDVDFGEVQTASDGGYERGYAEGHEAGNAEGYNKGHTDGVEQGYNAGLSARNYETWTITLVDDSVIEKDVALL